MSSGPLALIGAGKLGEALLSGLLRAGRPPEQVLVVVRRPERGQELAERHGVVAVPIAEAAARAGILLLAAKPQDMTVLLDQLAPHAGPQHLVVSLAAGITTAVVEARLGAGVRVVRVMTNTPVLVDQAMSAVSAGAHTAEGDLETTEALLRPVGKVVRVPESQLDAVTALSGSGPAYFFYLVEAMVDAGLLLGLPRALAAELLVQTALGAAVMLRDSGERPSTLREQVMSPGGTTIAAVRALEDHGVRAALLAALEAARDRARELAAG